MLALASAFIGGGNAAAQTQSSSAGAGQAPQRVTDDQIAQAREENRRLAEYSAEVTAQNRAIQQAMVLQQQQHELQQRAAEQESALFLAAQDADYRREHDRLLATAATERGRAADRRELARATERHGRSAFFPRTNAGMPGECHPRSPAVPDLEAEPESLQDVLASLQQCYYAFTERGEPFVNRRAAYSGVASVGALGGAIGGDALAASSAAAWGGLVLLPIIVEGTVDRPEFDSLDRVTARGLNWVNGRAVQMNAIQRRLSNEREALGGQFQTFNTAWTGADRAMLQRLISTNAAAEGETPDPSPEISSAAALRIQQSIEDIMTEARATQRDLHANEEHVRVLLPTWAQMRFNRVMDNYSSHRRDMTLRPQAAARSIVALPFSSLANFIRGEDDRVRTQSYFTSSVAATLRDLHAPMNLPALGSRDAAEIDYLDLSSFPEDDRDDIRGMVERANELRDATLHARALLAHAKEVDERGPPLFDEVGAETAQNEDAAGESQRAASETPPTDAPETPAPAEGGDESTPSENQTPEPAGGN